MKAIFTYAAAAMVGGTMMIAQPVMAATYALFDHRAGGNVGSYDYGLRLDTLGANQAASYWSFETTDDKSLAKMTIDIGAGTGSVTGQMRSNDGDTLWDLNITMTGVVSLASLGAGNKSFGATGYTGTLTDGSTTYDLVGKGKNVGGTAYHWTYFSKQPTVGSDWRAPNITAGWVSSLDGGTSMIGGTNDFIAEVSAVPLPAGAVLLLTALGGIGVMRRKRKQS